MKSEIDLNLQPAIDLNIKQIPNSQSRKLLTGERACYKS